MSTQDERTQIAVLQNDMHQVKSDVGELKTTMASGFASLEAKLEAQDKKYASKWVQQVVGGLIALILIAVVTALLALVIIPATKKPQQVPVTSSSSTTTSGGSGSSVGTTPGGANATANAKADATKPTDSQSSSGGLLNTLPKLGL